MDQMPTDPQSMTGWSPDDSGKESWTQSKPKLRPDLRFFPQQLDGQRVIVVEDPVRSRFYRIGKAEYAFVSQLNGNLSVDEAFEKAKLKSSRGDSEFDLDREDAQAICEFCFQSNLFRVVDEDILRGQAESETHGTAPSSNLLFQRFPICDPSRWLEKSKPIYQALFSIPGALIWLFLVGLAVYLVSGKVSEFQSASNGILAGNAWLGLVLAWVVLKIIHEFGHASCCHRFGGHVREFGVALICFFPVAYVDVTSCWRLSSKWQRMFISAAGIYVELAIAAIATIGWCLVEDPLVKSYLYNVIIVASFSTIVFNLNPLMKFDGYYILSDLVEKPKLYQQSQTEFKSFITRIFFGNCENEEQGNLWVLLYGMAVFCWRIIVCLGILLSVSMMGLGWGILLASIVLVSWCLPLAYHSFNNCVETFRTLKPAQWLRLSFVSLSICLLFGGVGRVFLLPRHIIAYGIVTAKDEEIARAKTDGFVRKIFVRPNQLVQPGTPLIEFENLELENELVCLRLDEQKLRLEIEQYRADGEVSRALAESKLLRKLQGRIRHKQQQVDSLTIRSQSRGHVLVRDVNQLLGKFLTEGEEVLSIINPQEKEVVAAVSQFQIDGMGDYVKQQLQGGGRFYLPETGPSSATISQVSPKATLSAANPLLGANVGGPLPVRVAQSKEQGKPEHELLEPHFQVKFELDGRQSCLLEQGRRVRITLNGKSTSLGFQLYKSLRRWLENKVDAATGNAK